MLLVQVALVALTGLISSSSASLHTVRAAKKPSKAASSGDTVILNNLLAIEQASASFYKRANGYFVAEDWTDLGVSRNIMDRHASWAAEDAAHVSLLSGAISGDKPAPCSYRFNYVHAPQFLAISRSLDGMAASAYIGAVGALDSADARVLAASILANKARRQALTNEILGFSSIPTAVDTPLDAPQTFSALSAYITSCPSGNPSTPGAFPALTVSTAAPAAGKSITVKASKLGAFLHVLSASGDQAVPLTSVGTATLPSGLAGRIYLLTSDSKSLTDANTNSGPAIVDLPDAKASRIFTFGKQNVSWKSES